jgi:hypothetical protein
MSACSSVDSALSTINNVAPANSQTLLRLPPELVNEVALNLDNSDLISLRATCREMRDGSAFAFCRRYFATDELEISGTSSSIQDLTDMLLSSNLRSARHFARILKMTAPTVNPSWPIDVAYLRQNLLPSSEDATRLLAAMPNLTYIRLDDLQRFVEPEVSAIHSAPVLLKSLATPGSHLPQLRTLWLSGFRVDAALLASMLEMQKHSLEVIYFASVVTTGTASWMDILKALHSTNVERILIWDMDFVDDNGEVMGFQFPAEVYQAVRDTRDPQPLLDKGYVYSSRAKHTLGMILQAAGIEV